MLNFSFSLFQEETEKQQRLLVQQLSDLDTAVTRLKCISHDRARSQVLTGVDWMSCAVSSRKVSSGLSPEQLCLISTALTPNSQETQSPCSGFPVGSRQIAGRLRAARRQRSDLTALRRPSPTKYSRSLRNSVSSPAISLSSSFSDRAELGSDGEDVIDGDVHSDLAADPADPEILDSEILDFRLWLSMQSHTWC